MVAHVKEQQAKLAGHGVGEEQQAAAGPAKGKVFKWEDDDQKQSEEKLPELSMVSFAVRTKGKAGTDFILLNQRKARITANDRRILVEVYFDATAVHRAQVRRRALHNLGADYQYKKNRYEEKMKRAWEREEIFLNNLQDVCEKAERERRRESARMWLRVYAVAQYLEAAKQIMEDNEKPVAEKAEKLKKNQHLQAKANLQIIEKWGEEKGMQMIEFNEKEDLPLALEAATKSVCTKMLMIRKIHRARYQRVLRERCAAVVKIRKSMEVLGQPKYRFMFLSCSLTFKVRMIQGAVRRWRMAAHMLLQVLVARWRRQVCDHNRPPKKTITACGYHLVATFLVPPRGPREMNPQKRFVSARDFIILCDKPPQEKILLTERFKKRKEEEERKAKEAERRKADEAHAAQESAKAMAKNVGRKGPKKSVFFGPGAHLGDHGSGEDEVDKSRRGADEADKSRKFGRSRLRGGRSGQK